MSKFRYSVLVSILLVVQLVLNPVSANEDFNPYGPKGEKELTIVKPTENSVIKGDARHFLLLISGEFPKPEWIIKLEWARIEPARDPSIEIGGRWFVNTPPNALPAISWTSSTSRSQYTEISMDGFRPGHYAVRARIWASPRNTWTDWRKFEIGKTPNRLKTTGNKIPTKDKTTTRLRSAPGAMKIKPSIKPTAQRDTRVDTEMVELNLQGAKPLTTQRVVRSGTRTATMSLKRPSLWINNKKVVATTAPKLNKPFGVSVNLTNLGNAVNGNTSTNKVTIKASCVPLTGGACKTNLSLPVPIIQPGQSRTWGNLQGLFTASQPGKYRVSVSIKSADTPKKIARAGFSQTWSKDFTIKTVSIKPGVPTPGTTKKLNRIPMPGR